MATTNNIPGLPLATGVLGTDELWIVQNSVDKRTTIAQIAGYAQTTAAAALSVTAPLQRNGNVVSLGGFAGTTDNGVMYRASSAAVGVTAAGTIGQLLMAQGAATAPTWATAGTTGQLLIGRTTAAVAWLSAATTGQLLAATTGGDPFWIPAGVSGQVLSGVTGANPTWSSTIPPSAGVTSFSGGTTGLTPAGATVGAVLLGGVLNVVNGGTGVTAATGSGPNTVLSTQPGILSAQLTTPTILGALTYGGVTLSAAVTGTGPMALGIRPNLVTATLATPTITGALTYGGVTLSAAVTGTGPMMLGIAPTILGALTYGGVTLSAAVTGTGPMVLGVAPALSSPVFVGPALGTPISGSLVNCTGFPGSTAGNGTTFMGSDTAVSAVAFTNLANTGSIGAAGQVWLILVTETALNTVGAVFVECAIFDGSSQIACVEGVTLGASLSVALATNIVVTLSGATTFTLQSRTNAASTTAKTSSSNVSNKATSITAVRLS